MATWRDIPKTEKARRMTARHTAACRGELEPYEYALMFRPCASADLWRREGNYYKAKFLAEDMAGRWASKESN